MAARRTGLRGSRPRVHNPGKSAVNRSANPMQTRNRILDDMARVASGALGTATGLRGEIEALIRERLKRVLGDMELVDREEFEAVKAMAAKARTEQEKMAATIETLQAELAALKGAGAKPGKPAALKKA
ncbi:MAG TPA: accessory factor UbiK family protein [Alphaproteobacteria bacterium]|nr:accessory factor UbiK family protein [Alphaproteobacteria bacterium]